MMRRYDGFSFESVEEDENEVNGFPEKKNKTGRPSTTR